MELKLKFNNDNLSEFKSILSDLSKISNIVKIKITGKTMMAYAIDSDGEGSSSTSLAFKVYTLPVDYFFKTFKAEYGIDDQEETAVDIDWIIRNVGVLNKRLSFIGNNKSSDIKAVMKLRKLSGTDSLYARSVVISDSIFKFSLTGDEPHTIRDISLQQLNTIVDQSLSEFSFKVSSELFKEAKRASKVESEKIISIDIKNKRILFNQSTWELCVGQIDLSDQRKISFDRKYLDSINPVVDEAFFSVFQSFILFQEGNQKLIVGFEQSF